MPKITAASVHEHVARQEAAVIDAAIRLFNERGVADVSLADIAHEVGLARNSLYRYFPDKAHIVAAWFRATIDPLVDLCDEIAASERPATERVLRWVDAQFDSLTAPESAVMLIAVNDLAALPEDVTDELAAGHSALYGSLVRILTDGFADRPERDPMLATTFVGAVTRSAAEQVRSGADPDRCRAELRRAALALVDHRAQEGHVMNEPGGHR